MSACVYLCVCVSACVSLCVSACVCVSAVFGHAPKWLKCCRNEKLLQSTFRRKAEKKRWKKKARWQKRQRIANKSAKMQMSFDLTICCLSISIAGACLSQFSICSNPQSESPAWRARSVEHRQWARFACVGQDTQPAAAFIVKQIFSREREGRKCELAGAISNVFTLAANQQSEHQKKKPKNFQVFLLFFGFSVFFFHFPLHTSSPCPGRLPSICRCPPLCLLLLLLVVVMFFLVFFFLALLSALCAISIRIQVPPDLKVNWPSRALHLLLPQLPLLFFPSRYAFLSRMPANKRVASKQNLWRS